MIDLTAIPRGELELLYQAAAEDEAFARKIFGYPLLSPAPEDQVPTPINWPLIGSIAGAAALIVTMVVLMKK